MAILKDGDCQYCVVQHETLSSRLGISEEKIADIGGHRYKTSPHFSDAEKTLLDLTVQIGINANSYQESYRTSFINTSRNRRSSKPFSPLPCISLSVKFGDGLGVELEPVFSGLNPILEVTKH